MTTIAWDGKTLAGDRRITGNGNQVTEATKVFKRKDGALIGWAGEPCTAREFVDWFLSGEKKLQSKPSLMAKNTQESNAGVIIIRPNGKAEFHDKCGWHRIESKHFALGTGEIAALAAMKAGVYADRAIEIAAELDVYTGGGVDFVEFGK